MQKSMIKLISIADLLTLLNAIFGVLAILVLFSGLFDSESSIHLSLSLILIALVIDGIDGIVARKIGASNIGEYLESMADMTSLVIAPSILLYFIYNTTIIYSTERHLYLIIALLLFLSFGIIRLASFHVMKKDKLFVGLPASAATIILLILGYFKVDLVYILPAVIIIGALMASTIRFPKPDIKINAFATILIILTVILGKSFYGIAPILLLLGILTYAIVGPIYIRFFTK